jgi:predicted RNA-binding protein with PUA-like domain
VIFYHSNTEPPHAAGVAEIVREAYPDHTAWDPESEYHDPRSTPEKPSWLMVDVRALRALPMPVSLATMKGNPLLEDMPLVRRGNRLSVFPISEVHYLEILRMGGLEDF